MTTPNRTNRIAGADVNQKSVLSNGLRVVTEELPYFHSVAVGVWLNVGSRDETRAENGLSHFLEHMAFKGTPRRTALDIAREIDQIGGSCNAFTSKEQTCFHGKVLAEHLPRLVDLLGDMMLTPSGSPRTWRRSARSSWRRFTPRTTIPKTRCRSPLAATSGGDNPLGRPILGEAEHIAAVNREDLLAYRQATYRPEETVVAAAGRVATRNWWTWWPPVSQDFANGAPARERQAVTTHPGIYPLSRDLEQVYLVWGPGAWPPAIPAASPPPCSS